MTTVIASVGIPPTAEGAGGGSKARLDAAHALLGVVAVSSSSSPTTIATNSEDVTDMTIDEEKKDEAHPNDTSSSSSWEATLLRMRDDPSSSGGLSLPDERKESAEVVPPSPTAKKNMVDGEAEDDRAPCALDALAMLASNAVSMDCDASNTKVTTTATSDTANDKDDATAEATETTWVRPPRRERSISNPEGMEKWDSLLMAGRRTDVATIDEESEEAMMQMDDDGGGGGGSDPERERGRSASPLSSALRKGGVNRRKLPLKKRVNFRADAVTNNGPEPCESKSKSTPEEDLDEMLRRARSKLLEDLVTGNAGEDGGLVLPHALEKYQDIYNKNGRVGIYDPSERAAIIARFHGKRSRRVWNKRIRYSCRKNLADRRLRVKGRFVKRSDPPAPSSPGSGPNPEADGDAAGEGEGSCPSSPTAAASAASGSPAEEAPPPEEDMPDTTDVEAGFCPTEDQPYRRTRRHTIT